MIPPNIAVEEESVVSPRRAWFTRDWFWGLVLILAIFLAYLPVWFAGFIWDDNLVLTDNASIAGPLGFKEIWTTSAADICPLTLTTFWLEHALWGFAPLPYHLVDVLLHGACTVTLWRVLRLLRVPGAWLGAALWGLHPVEVESVAWIAETKNTQSGLFFLLSILFFVRWLRTNANEGARARWCYALSLLCGALAMASKSSTVILPVVLCLCAWWVEGRWQWRNLARVAPVFLMTVAASALAEWTQGFQLAREYDTQWARTWPERLVAAGDAVWFYLGKLLWPHPLVTIYPRWQIDAGQWVSYLPLLAVLIVLLVLWLNRERWSRPWFFAFAYFVVALIPALGLVDNFIFRYSLVFDHLQYLAAMGPLALAGAGMARFSSFALSERPRLRSASCAGVLLVLGLLSWQRARAFENEETLWSDTLAWNPHSWLAYNNLGNPLLQKGHVDEAIADYEKALEINPNYAEAHSNLGYALLQKGQVGEAVAELVRAVQLDPRFADAHYNLGLALSQAGKLDEAMAEYQKALECDPNLADAHNNLGNALAQKGRVDEAMAEYQEALALNPSFAEAHYNLGLCFSLTGKLDEAMAEYEKALEINPRYAEAHNNLGNAFAQKGREDEAIVEFQKALEINPQYAEAYYNFGNALAREGRLDEAIAEFRKAVEINPNLAQVHNNLGHALLEKGRLNEATIEFQEALRLKPGYKAAQTNLAKVQAMARPRAGGK